MHLHTGLCTCLDSAWFDKGKQLFAGHPEEQQTKTKTTTTNQQGKYLRKGVYPQDKADNTTMLPLPASAQSPTQRIRGG